MSKDLAASVRARLLNLAKAEGTDFNQILVRYALERFLYRLSQSAHADRFMLKGALLFTLWYDMPNRPTRDPDLLGFGPSDLESIGSTFRDITAVAVDDGIVFEPASISVNEIRKEAAYAGVRVLINGDLAKARCKTQIDIGFGDAVTPARSKPCIPFLIKDLPAPRLRTYPAYTVVAEKLHAIALLGMTNSRLKDYLDLSVLFDRETLDLDTLALAISATFHRRAMAVPKQTPVGLTDEFANDASRAAIWQAFLRKNELPPMLLIHVVASLRAALQPALDKALLIAVAMDDDGGSAART